jgi:hypothetical protein
MIKLTNGQDNFLRSDSEWLCSQKLYDWSDCGRKWLFERASVIVVPGWRTEFATIGQNDRQTLSDDWKISRRENSDRSLITLCKHQRVYLFHRHSEFVVFSRFQWSGWFSVLLIVSGDLSHGITFFPDLSIWTTVYHNCNYMGRRCLIAFRRHFGKVQKLISQWSDIHHLDCPRSDFIQKSIEEREFMWHYQIHRCFEIFNLP